MDKDEKANLKKTLPIVLFGGTFTKRSKDGFRSGSGLITLDFDEGDNLKKIREVLQGWGCTYSCFTSPSGGDRFKAIIRIPDVLNDDEYKEFYNFFCEKYPIDKSGKDVSRSCFISYDPNLYLNENAKVFTKDMLKKYSKNHIKKPSNQKLIETIANWIRYANKGERHYQCLRASYYAGGLAAMGQIDEDSSLIILKKAATDRGGEVDQSIRAIDDSFEKGKQNPILNISELDNAVRSMKPKVDVKSFIVKKEDIDKQSEEYFSGTGVKAYETGIPDLDYYYSYRPNTFYTATGGKAAGKTTLKIYTSTYFALNHGLKYLIISYENEAFEIEQEVIGFLCQDNPEWVYKNQRILYEKAKDFFHNHFVVLRFPPDYRFTDITEAAAQLNSQSEYHELIIDPLFKVAGTDDYTENKLIARHAQPFAQDVMSLWCNMHPTGAAQRDGKHVSDLNAEFGGLYSNAADITIAISRFYKDPDPDVRCTVNMSIDKVRSKKLKGGMETVKECPIKWQYDWKKHNYNIWIPNKVDSSTYTKVDGGLMRNVKSKFI